MINSFERREKKFLITEEQFSNLLPKIIEHMNYDKYCIDGSKYLIRNIYLDTKDNHLIRLSTSKPKFKEKIRIRKYGKWNDDKDEYFLEIKRKINKIVVKRRVKLTRYELDNFLNKGIIPNKSKFVNHQIIKEIEYFLKLYKVENKVFIYYERLAFFDKEDKNFRISFDSNIKTRRNNFDFDNDEYEQSLIGEDHYLMEVKITKSFPLWFAKELSKNNIYSQSFSKYGTEYKNTVLEGDLLYV